MITKEQIGELSDFFQIDGFTVAREYLQLLFLSYLYQEKGADKIYFKGGTSIRLLFDSPRFSEDLDFSTTYSREQIAKLIKKLEGKIKKELPEARITQIYSGEESIRFRMKYSFFGFKYPLVIRLDFNEVKRVEDKTASPLVTRFPIIIFPLIYHLSKEEILAEKIRALATRGKGRDMFDVWFLFSKKVNLDDGLLKLKFKEIQRVYDKKAVLEKIKSYPQTRLNRDLMRFLPKPQRKIVSLLKTELVRKGLFGD